MKTRLFFCMSLFLLLNCGTALAQTAPNASSATGYWNTETNLTTRDYTIVRFYNDQDHLLYQERLDGVCLDLSRRRVRRRTSAKLNAALQQVLQDPSASRSLNLVAQQLGTAQRTPRAYAAR
ncbi:MAG TPA: hypothetical protein VF629_13130 [Hymenobacter sp.]|jgi:hypothetical protein|uniref:hypothetical protein n=1 Tax=Hymenobacter sp. TaxID=1898978 RepID=UPI002EDAC4A1